MAKGSVATLYGNNMGKVKAIVIGGQTVGEADIEAGTDVFAQLKPGAVLKIAYSVEPSAEYHQLKVAIGWWTDLRDNIEFSEDGVYEMTLTQDDLDKIQQQAGFLCVGHGYYVDRVSVK